VSDLPRKAVPPVEASGAAWRFAGDTVLQERTSKRCELSSPSVPRLGANGRNRLHRCYNESMRQFARKRLDRRFVVLLTVAACGALGIGAGALVASGAGSDSASIVVTYVSPTSFRVKLGDGTNVTSGTTIPAGSYQIYVYDDSEDSSPAFSFTGPGVSISSNLNSTGMGIDSPSVFGVVTLQTSSSYRMQDSAVGASSLINFSTSSTAGATVVVGTTSSGPPPSATSPATTTTIDRGPNPVMVAIRGTLAGSVSAAGKPVLMLGGKPVKTLKAGRYRVSVGDHSRKAGLIIGTTGKHTITLSKTAAVGTSAKTTVTLSTGKWFLEASARGPKTWFRVT
jgi:hypothetical protein